MSRKLFFATVAFAIAVNFSDHAFAGANDYVFEPVKAVPLPKIVIQK